MNQSNWTPALFASIDAKDTDRFLSHLCDDATFRFANQPAAIGHPAIGEVVGGFFAAIGASRHEVSNVWTLGKTVICRGQVTYTRLDGSLLSVPFVNVFDMAATLIREYSIYVDASALFSPMRPADMRATPALHGNGSVHPLA